MPTAPPRRFCFILVALLGLLVLGWALGRLAVATVGGVDLSLVRDVAGDRTRTLTTTARALSFIGSGPVVFSLAAVVAVALLLRRRVAAAGVPALGALGGALISSVDKLLVDRPRPPVRHLQHVVSASFPSGHATQSSAVYVALLAVALAALGSRRAPARALIALTVLVVLGVAASRVYLGVHYPSDVVTGMALGTAWSYTVARLLIVPPPFTSPALPPRPETSPAS